MEECLRGRRVGLLARALAHEIVTSQFQEEEKSNSSKGPYEMIKSLLEQLETTTELIRRKNEDEAVESTDSEEILEAHRIALLEAARKI